MKKSSTHCLSIVNDLNEPLGFVLVLTFQVYVIDVLWRIYMNALLVRYLRFFLGLQCHKIFSKSFTRMVVKSQRY